MFLDASAIVAILSEEEDAESILAKIKNARNGLFYSPIYAYESVISLARKKTLIARDNGPIPPPLIDQAEEFVRHFLDEINAIEIPVTMDIERSAVSACKAYGSAVGHLAKLNMGDCFAYACACSNGLPLLFKGNDFPHTDIAAA